MQQCFLSSKTNNPFHKLHQDHTLLTPHTTLALIYKYIYLQNPHKSKPQINLLFPAHTNPAVHVIGWPNGPEEICWRIVQTVLLLALSSIIHMYMSSLWTWWVLCYWNRWPKGKRFAFGALLSPASLPHPLETGFEISMSAELSHHLGMILLYLIQPHTGEPYCLPSSLTLFGDSFLADNISSAAFHRSPNEYCD